MIKTNTLLIWSLFYSMPAMQRCIAEKSAAAKASTSFGSGMMEQIQALPQAGRKDFASTRRTARGSSVSEPEITVYPAEWNREQPQLPDGTE